MTWAIWIGGWLCMALVCVAFYLLGVQIGYRKGRDEDGRQGPPAGSGTDTYEDGVRDAAEVATARAPLYDLSGKNACREVASSILALGRKWEEVENGE